ncbi:MAG: carbon starvation protein A [Planctomycetota bacterium]|nr:MAG: carbon starvation protein A [Planctomycetota bacterium]
MNAIWIVVAGLVLYFAGYRFYAKYLAERIFKLDPNAPVPSREMEDGVDYIPTNRYVLFGHHFASIAGAAPIVGPAIAVIWGWFPAFLWVVLGAVFLGCVHDFSALILSVRRRGRSIGDLAGDIIGKKATTAYLVIMFFVVVLLMAIFLRLIAGLLMRYPEVVIPAAALIVIAIGIGLLIYRTKIGLGVASIVGIILMLLSIWVGTKNPLVLSENLAVNTPFFTWVVMLAIYSFVASVLPVWLLLQPRDYLESFKLYAGLILLFVGIIVTRPEIVAPAIRPVVEGAPPIWPFLFVTIACGALTGFHSIVASGTTSKQLAKETDATFVGYGAMAAESALALCAIIACTAGFVAVGGKTGRQLWMAHYGTWGSAAGLWEKVGAFVDGSAYFMSSLGIPETLGKTFMGLMIVAFAMTTLDSACRLGRYILAEFGRRRRMPFLTNGYIGSGLAAGIALLLALMPGTEGKSVGQLLWPLFGTTNQLLAALVFATVTVYLVKRKTAHWFISIPLVFVAITTISAMIWNIRQYIRKENWILTVVGSIILLAAFYLIALSCGSFMRVRAQVKAEGESTQV